MASLVVPKEYAVLGAGDVGCAVGIAMAAAGHTVTFIGRNSPTGTALQAAASRGGVRLLATKGWEASLSAERCAAAFTTDVARLATADVIFLATKRHDNSTVVPHIAKYAKTGSPVLIVAMQNGVRIAEEIHNLLAKAPGGDRKEIIGVVIHMPALVGVLSPPTKLGVRFPRELETPVC